uniref:FIGfam138462: acyl-CoA synthetase, AMP-(Fatty) acid ligase n=1 Tax=uncultured bacterium contig00031 TaxID=1181520 RepID=A0A806KM80_9BACT|nr:FIGfam138462: acyl-CoA synthetase, AMP-(fatty) acid ligase [uncultured bacterium contig00031]
MIYRFAVLQDKSIAHSAGKNATASYCKKVTVVWVVFFICNGSMAAWSIFSGSGIFWAVYNGAVSYILMGILFTVEFIVRKKVQKKMTKAIPLSAINFKSRDPSTILCYDGAFGDGIYKTFKDFIEDTARMRIHLKTIDKKRWLLYCEDCYYFLVAFTALLQCKKEILISANNSPVYMAEIRSTPMADGIPSVDRAGNVPFLTEQVFAEGECPENTFNIPALLQNNAEEKTDTTEWPLINRDETAIIMYTSGSTGKPKAIRQRLTELENDNSFALSKWGKEISCRKVCSTVSHHHIYGILFSILLPFTAGTPFRRKRVQFPEELEKLTDTEYMFITAPAFLKRVVADENPISLQLKSPWIFAAGGVLNHETAKKTSEVFGFWPVEIYGSTETSGIAWRQSDKGQEWTPFDNTQITQNAEGCLIIRSPCIKDTDGFETADMGEILPDGRFLLKGRIDSIVKIEEKRISLAEMENRIVQSGLVSDVCVLALESKRQYLAAAMVLNDKGKEKFCGFEKMQINTFWREYLMQYFDSTVIPKRWRYPKTLPTDEQGKTIRKAIADLFNDIKFHCKKIVEKTDKSITVEFSVPDTSPFFDGHFPGCPILPAVAQIDIVLSVASQHLGTFKVLSGIRKVKFSSIIRPNIPLVLWVEKDGNNISFKIYNPNDKAITYSSGTLMLPENSLYPTGNILLTI